MAGSHQTAVPLVFSDLLPQTLQLQLVDLQVGPGNDTSALSDPPEAADSCWDVFTHCKPLRKAAYTSSSRSGWGVLVGGSLVEPVNILLPYKARFSGIKRCWGKKRSTAPLLIKAWELILQSREVVLTC